LFLCYNVALADQLSVLVAKRKCQKGEVTVRSWEELARELLNAAGVGWDEPTSPKERELYFGEVVPSLMREIARDPHFESRFDALVVDEAQDHDTCWPGNPTKPTLVGGRFTGSFLKKEPMVQWLSSTTGTRDRSFAKRNDSKLCASLNGCRDQRK
jgi:hypothetical protein